MTPQILALDIAGNPFDWISAQDAVHYYATNKVAWELGDREFLFRGGVSNAGILSTLTVKPIIAISGSERMQNGRRGTRLGTGKSCQYGLRVHGGHGLDSKCRGHP